MAIVKDPQGNETRALSEMLDFRPKEVFEVGCGDGRLTWRYIEKAGHITAIDPIEREIEAARANLPAKYAKRVNFIVSTIQDCCQSLSAPRFDLVIFAWSL